MALVDVGAVIVPEEFAAYTQLLTTVKSAFVQSGVLAGNPLFDQFLAGGGVTFNMPFWNDLADTEANVSKDTVADVIGGTLSVGDSVPLAISTGKEIAIRMSRNQSWSAADLAGDLAGSDPMTAMANRVADYWTRQLQLSVLAAIKGILVDNVANDSGDMVNDIHTASSVTDANRFSAEAFLDTVQTMGDRGEELAAVAMHSVIYRRAQKLNLIDFIPDASGQIQIPTYLGRRVIVDDALVGVTDTNATYVTYLFGAGAVAFAQGSPKVPVEVTRFALAGKGGGQEVLTTRKEMLIHPRGFAFIGSPSDDSPTNTELAASGSWDRRFARKNIRIASLRTNA
jgi:hypothetical protein